MEITEFNIGHNIVARAIFVGLETAVREMKRGDKSLCLAGSTLTNADFARPRKL